MNKSQSASLVLACVLIAGSASHVRAADVTLVHSHDLWNFGGNWSGGYVPAYPDNVTIPAGMDVQMTDFHNTNVLNNAGVIYLANANAGLASFAPSNLGTLFFYVSGSVYSSYESSHIGAILVNNGANCRFRVMNASVMDTSYSGHSRMYGGHLTMQGDGQSQFRNTQLSLFDITGELTLDTLPFYNLYDGGVHLTSPAVIDSVNSSIGFFNGGGFTAAAGTGGSCSVSPNVAFQNTGTVLCTSGVLHIQNCTSFSGGTLTSGNWMVEGSGQIYLNSFENISTIGRGAIVNFTGDLADVPQVHAVSNIAGDLYLHGRSFECTPPGLSVYNNGYVLIDPGSRFRAHSSFLSLAGSTLAIRVNGPGDNGLVVCDDVAAIYGYVELDFQGSYRPQCGDRIQIMTGQRLYDFHTDFITPGWTPPSTMLMTIEQRNGALEVVFSSTADFNHDGSTDFFDYLDFVDAFSAADSVADFNSDGAIDFFDYLDFVDAFSAGC